MTRVLWVTEDASRPGGVESVLRALDAGLTERGFDSTVVSWAPPARRIGLGSSPLSWLGDKVTAAWQREITARSTARSLRRRLAADPDLVVVLDTGSLSVARHLGRSPRWGIHVHWTPDLVLHPWRHLAGDGIPPALVPFVHARMRVVGRGNARVLRSAPFVVTLTPSHTRVLSSLMPRVQEIRNPIECEPFARRPIVDDVVTIGYVGRLSYEKGPDVLVEALAGIDGSVGPTRVLVAGSGPLEDSVRRRADALGVPDVEFLGWVDDPRSVLERLDVLVLPSRAEAVPLVLVEALGAGCLVVSADAGSGVRDLLGRGLGDVVPTEDPEALASAIERAVRDVRDGRAPDPLDVASLVESHSPEVVLHRWVCFLEGQAAAGS